MTWLSESVKWYLVLVAASWGLGPLVALLCRRLPDRGVTIVRPLALLGVVYPTWLLASIKVIPYSTAGLWATLAVLAVLGWGWFIKSRQLSVQWLKWMLLSEAISLVAFAAYLGLRGYTPAILNTEKPMDSAFLSSSARTTVMPPPDPWMAGEPINYYYLGYLLHGSVSRMATVPTNYGFNLALATTFSMTLTAAAGLGFNIARAWLSRARAIAAGILTPVFLVLVGNMYAVVQLVQHPSATIHATWWPSGSVNIGWNASRVVCDLPRVNGACPGNGETINEFPFFSFLLGDLHPHLMALPFTLVALALGLNLLLLYRRQGADRLRHTDWPAIIVSGAAIGALYMLNSWDLPTYLLVALIALWLGLPWLRGWARVAPLAAMIAAAIVAWFPFIATFKPFAGGSVSELPASLQHVPVVTKFLTTIGATGSHTSVGEFLEIFAVPFVACLALLLPYLAERTGAGAFHGDGTPVIISVVALAALAIFTAAPLAALCGIPVVLIVLLLTRQPALDPRAIALFLFGLGLLLIVLTEFFFIQDAFASHRMNTLFKVYYQAWTMFAVGTALSVTLLWDTAKIRRTVVRPLVATGLAVALLAGAVYPILGSIQWTATQGPVDHGPRQWQGLDGLSYIGQFSGGEQLALEWLSTHAKSNDVVLEAAGCDYQPWGAVPSSRVSAVTGIPTVMGWVGHEQQWRNGEPQLFAQLATRHNDISALFAQPSGELARKYGITLLYIGPYERHGAGPACPDAGPYPETANPSYPGPGWQQVFKDGEVTIYRRVATTAQGS